MLTISTNIAILHIKCICINNLHDINVLLCMFKIISNVCRTPMCQEGYLIDMSRKSWAETPTNVKEDYGEEYFNAFLQVIRNASKSARPQVTEV